jgi:hypothetical protein
MPQVILHHLLNVSVQLANKRGLKKRLFWLLFNHLPEFIKCNTWLQIKLQLRVTILLLNFA